jgi:Heavy metal binding domain
MNILRLLILPSFVTVALLFATIGVYSPDVATAAQKERSAHSKKPPQFHYACPMHEDVTRKTSGTCPKCKMTLVKKTIVKQRPTGSN